MKVQAKEMGYYDNKRVREGQVFHLKNKEHFSKKWMIKFDEKKVRNDSPIAKNEISKDVI